MMLNIGARLNALGAMTACGLAPSLAKKHAIEQLTACSHVEVTNQNVFHAIFRCFDRSRQTGRTCTND